MIKEKFFDLLACPECKGSLRSYYGKLVCLNCKREYKICNDHTPIFLDPNVDFLPKEGGNISRNPYTDVSLCLIDKYKNGMILDDGAGAPSDNQNFDNVLQFEIVKYPSTDVVGVGEKLPFKDNSFDAVISESVLEHVEDPFSYVHEIYRVLKVGGEVYIDSAFLQPVHGYPCHYFNTTLMCLEMLFKHFEKIKSGVGAHQMPWVTLRWILNSYANGFKETEDKQKFLSTKIGEVLENLNQQVDIDPYNRLKEETIIELACGVNLLGKKSQINLYEKNTHFYELFPIKRGIRRFKEHGTIYTVKRTLKYLKDRI